VSPAQHLQALERAQATRRQVAAVRREIRAGTLPVTDALWDERARPITLDRLLSSRRGWGERRVRLELRALRAATDTQATVDLHPGTRVRELTDRQKHALAAHLQEQQP
jgi:hypothetical protein